MKGLKNRSESKTYWVTPSGGKMTLSSKEKRDGYVFKTFTGSDKKEYSKWVLEFDQLAGYITDVRTADTDYGKRWEVVVEIDDETYILCFKYSSGYSKSFLNQFPNIDLTKPVEVSASYEEAKDDKPQNAALWVRQGTGVKSDWVGFKYSKDNPGDRPDLEELTVKGEKVLDDTKRLAFHEKEVTAILNDFKLNKKTAEVENFLKSDGDFIDATADVPGISDDDLPF